MTKADIVTEIAKATGIEKTEVLAVVEAFMESVKKSLTNGQQVYLRGFGSFIIKHRAEKTARNIKKQTNSDHTCTQYSGIQAFKGFRRQGKGQLIFKFIILCQAVKKERDIRWQRTSVKSACARTDIRRSNFS